MRAVVQRVVKAKVFSNSTLINEISDGLLVYIGFTQSDNQIIADKMIRKIMNLRIFNDSNDKLNENILTVNGKILFISQFTLYGDVNRSNRPSFTQALNGEKAEPLYNY